MLTFRKPNCTADLGSFQDLCTLQLQIALKDRAFLQGFLAKAPRALCHVMSGCTAARAFKE